MPPHEHQEKHMTATPHRPTPPPTPRANDELLTLPEVADLVRVPVATLRYWRHLGSGPQSFRIGRTVRYWRSDVYRWLEKQSSRPQRSR
jgi:predicted DNA-binding transcriptional regulator AlpA